jgi:hypothetical protein
MNGCYVTSRWSHWPRGELARLPAARRRGMLVNMPKPIAKLVSMLKPKRRWAQFSLGTLLLTLRGLAVPSGWRPCWCTRSKRLAREV